MEYVSVIVDECNCIVRYCAQMSKKEIEEHLEQYPEHRLAVMEV